MSPSFMHERMQVAAGSDHRDPHRGTRHSARSPPASTTFKREDLDRGLEPDESLLSRTTLIDCAIRMTLDLDVDPPPDLAIEIEITRACLNRLGIYAGLASRRSGDSTARSEVLRSGRRHLCDPASRSSRSSDRGVRFCSTTTAMTAGTAIRTGSCHVRADGERDRPTGLRTCQIGTRIRRRARCGRSAGSSRSSSIPIRSSCSARAGDTDEDSDLDCS